MDICVNCDGLGHNAEDPEQICWLCLRAEMRAKREADTFDTEVDW